MKWNPYCLLIHVFLMIVYCFTFTTISAATRIKGDISAKTFTKSGNPYLVMEDIYIAEKGTTVIPAGIVLLFSNLTGFKVMGSLSVEGAEDDPVIFSSVFDVDYRPDAPHLANPDDWNGIFITQQAGNVTFHNFKIKYSTFGIKSRKPDIVIENGQFIENTQNMDIVKHQYLQVKGNEPFSNRLQTVASSSEMQTPGSVAESVYIADSTILMKDAAGGGNTVVTSELAPVSVDSLSKKPKNGIVATFKQLFNYNNHDNNIIVLRKRVRLSLIGAMALGGTAFWIVNHVQTSNHLEKMDEYSKKSRDSALSPADRLIAEANYNEECDLRKKSIQRVNVSAGMTIGLCIGLGLTLVF